jgi:hypothetical protein
MGLPVPLEALEKVSDHRREDHDIRGTRLSPRGAVDQGYWRSLTGGRLPAGNWIVVSPCKLLPVSGGV